MTCFRCLNRPTWNRLRFSSAPPSHPGIPPNLFTFLGHLQHVTTESTHDMARLNNGLRIKRAKKKMNLINERQIKACMGRFDAGSYICLSIILQLQDVYTTYLAAVTCILPLFWKELHTALYCYLFSNDVYILSSNFMSVIFMSVNFMSVNFMPGHLVRQFHVRQFHVRHFQSTRRDRQKRKGEI